MHVTVIKQGHVTPNLLKIWYLFSESDKHKRFFDVPAWKTNGLLYTLIIWLGIDEKCSLS